MQRLILALLTIFALTAAGALVAQSPETVPPGPTQQREPGLTSNNLPNPGNPQTDLSQRTPTSGEGVRPETEQGEGMDVDVDTGARAEGAVDVDVTRTTDADTEASGIDETGGMAGDTTTDTYGTDTYGDQDTLPGTASDLPLMALIGLICLGAAYSVRTLAKRDV